MRYALEKPGGLWYNIVMTIKKANKTVKIKRPERRKTAAKMTMNFAPSSGGKVTGTRMKMTAMLTASQDTGWKRLITKHFESFLKFFYADIHRDIDFKKGYEFLDKELQALVPQSETGERTADKLVKVWLKDGAEEWLLIHIEVQGKKEERFEERMYIYNSRIFWEYRKEVVTLVILADNNKSFRPEKYESRRWRFRHVMEFPTVKLLDYKGREAELEKINNPYSMAVQVQLKLLECGNKIDKKYTWKVALVRRLLVAGYKASEIQSLFEFVNWLMPLPMDKEKEYRDEVKKGPGGNKMGKLLSNYDKMVISERDQEMARGLLQDGVEPKIVAKRYGLTEKQIRSMLNSLTKEAA